MDFKVTIESQCDRGKYTGFLDRLQKFLNEECEAGVLKTNCDLHIEGDASFFSWGKFEGTEHQKCGKEVGECIKAAEVKKSPQW